MKKVDQIIVRHLSHNPDLYDLYMTHVRLVRDRALVIAGKYLELNPDAMLDLQLIEEGSLLHDIGIYRTNAPEIFCNGAAEYVEHGTIGRDILEKEGLPLHALIAERHTGSGISLEQIIKNNFPLPHRSMLPETVEEKVVCFADCFYSKIPDKLTEEYSLENIRAGLAKFGQAEVDRFDEMVALFGWD